MTADALSRIYGEANPALTYTVGGMGLVNGDTLSGALATGAMSNSVPGAYIISIGTLEVSSNYLIDFVEGVLEIGSGMTLAPMLLANKVFPEFLFAPVLPFSEYSDEELETLSQ